MRPKQVVPTLDIKGDKKVMLVEGGREVDMRDVTLGQEFIHEGSRWQAVGVPVMYKHVPASSRFRYCDDWLFRVNDLVWSQRLKPNGPFGDRSEKTMRVTDQSRVMLLSIEYRGPA